MTADLRDVRNDWTRDQASLLLEVAKKIKVKVTPTSPPTRLRVSVVRAVGDPSPRKTTLKQLRLKTAFDRRFQVKLKELRHVRIVMRHAQIEAGSDVWGETAKAHCYLHL